MKNKILNNKIVISLLHSHKDISDFKFWDNDNIEIKNI